MVNHSGYRMPRGCHRPYHVECAGSRPITSFSGVLATVRRPSESLGPLCGGTLESSRSPATRVSVSTVAATRTVDMNSKVFTDNRLIATQSTYVNRHDAPPWISSFLKVIAGQIRFSRPSRLVNDAPDLSSHLYGTRSFQGGSQRTYAIHPNS